MTLYKPLVRCPKCGRPPATRVSEEMVNRYRRRDPATELQTAQCTGCHTYYWIKAGHVADAVIDARARRP